MTLFFGAQQFCSARFQPVDIFAQRSTPRRNCSASARGTRSRALVREVFGDVAHRGASRRCCVQAERGAREAADLVRRDIADERATVLLRCPAAAAARARGISARARRRRGSARHRAAAPLPATLPRAPAGSAGRASSRICRRGRMRTSARFVACRSPSEAPSRSQRRPASPADSRARGERGKPRLLRLCGDSAMRRSRWSRAARLDAMQPSALFVRFRQTPCGDAPSKR